MAANNTQIVAVLVPGRGELAAKLAAAAAPDRELCHCTGPDRWMYFQLVVGSLVLLPASLCCCCAFELEDDGDE